MRPSITLPVAFLLAFLSFLSCSDDRRLLESLVELIELDYEDLCQQQARATWEELVSDNNALRKKVS